MKFSEIAEDVIGKIISVWIKSLRNLKKEAPVD